uniref:B30.2/SPRY domain-containing protein n=1 Tax=Scleropages formosus TaxID=113540 RepID=A0A8C9W3L8_SCLFO
FIISQPNTDVTMKFYKFSGKVFSNGEQHMASVKQCRPRCHSAVWGKYFCQLTLDPNTAHQELHLSEGKRKVTCRWNEFQPYPDHQDRFECWYQVLCAEGLSGRCYWEIQWKGKGAVIGVTYKGIRRKGDSDDCGLGFNDKSWSLRCSNESYSVRHNKKQTDIPTPPTPRVGVYLDWAAGNLSFYSVSSGELTLLYKFTSTFTEPLCPGFWVWHKSSVSLCKLR